MEKDDEMKGEGSFYDFGLRCYDPRLARMMSIDPRTREYAWQTTYAYHRNNPILQVDYLGGGDPPPVEPKRHSIKVEAGDNLWNIASRELGAQATNNAINNRVNELIAINKLNSKGTIYSGQTLFTESQSAFKNRFDSYLKEKETYDRQWFESFPEVTPDPRNSNQIRRGRNLDDQGLFFRRVDSWDELNHASITGADYAIVEGGLATSLENDIHIMHSPDNSDFYQTIADQLIASGKAYITDYSNVRYGPISAVKGYTHKSAYVMRNGGVKYWASYDVNGNIKIEVHAFDTYNVTPQTDKGPVYNFFANILNPIHLRSGGNPNMKTRATWTRTIR